MDSELIQFWLVIVLMIIAGLSGACCGYKLKSSNVPMKLLKVVAITSGISISIAAVYLLVEYPKTTYELESEYNKPLKRDS
ncbi:hypothetical protein I6M38_08680 [Shewanella algae]|uniref:hypothetical protein n=1 Tax=Shewanella algae TaxID=38313 RepID=UPI001AACDF2B|nr:hypothetical protein [Shewanella algae]MBO2552058.1 hypothetical protein [Shewanella algae]